MGYLNAKPPHENMKNMVTRIPEDAVELLDAVAQRQEMGIFALNQQLLAWGLIEFLHRNANCLDIVAEPAKARVAAVLGDTAVEHVAFESMSTEELVYIVFPDARMDEPDAGGPTSQT